MTITLQAAWVEAVRSFFDELVGQPFEFYLYEYKARVMAYQQTPERTTYRDLYVVEPTGVYFKSDCWYSLKDIDQKVGPIEMALWERGLIQMFTEDKES